MSEKAEKKKEKERENGEVILDHFYHEHPLTLTESDEEYEECYGCRRYIFAGETVYKCRDKCRYSPTLHEECAEMPREIRLSMHPQHTLIQKEDLNDVPNCEVCGSDINGIGYYCSNSDSCHFRIHVGCALNMSVMNMNSSIDHPSHPHRLKLLWRPGRSCLSRCDACATIERGHSYICINDCNYWIHESCATLPATATNYGHLHQHPLSLAYHVPLELMRLKFPCNICLKDFLPRYWVYHCGICRYVVHIKCAINASSSTPNNINIAGDDDDKDVIAFPVDNVAEELIEPFVMRFYEGGKAIIPAPGAKYKFRHHNHELTLISHHDHEEEEYSSDDDDGLNLRKKSELVCDGCTTPIHGKFYMSCCECKYFLHWACFNLPPCLPSHPLHPPLYHDPNLILKTTTRLETTLCNICHAYTSGLFYECTVCCFKADIKCVSLPDTIKHSAHPYQYHHLKLFTPENISFEFLCAACDRDTYEEACYKCDICKIIWHARCISLPAAVTNPRWDSHPLPLTFDATLNHPADFYCDVCEKKMNPRSWMYHCRSCDLSFHPRCFPTASGRYRNIKFGQRYAVSAVHHHPIAYQLLTNKLRCDVCGRKRYGRFGFQCALEKCNFFMCLHPCGKARQDEFVAVD